MSRQKPACCLGHITGQSQLGLADCKGLREGSSLLLAATHSSIFQGGFGCLARSGLEVRATRGHQWLSQHRLSLQPQPPFSRRVRTVVDGMSQPRPEMSHPQPESCSEQCSSFPIQDTQATVHYPASPAHNAVTTRWLSCPLVFSSLGICFYLLLPERMNIHGKPQSIMYMIDSDFMHTQPAQPHLLHEIATTQPKVNGKLSCVHHPGPSFLLWVECVCLPLQNSYVEILTSSVMVLGSGALGK